MIVRTKALVIKEHIFGESDKYITLFTKELGKVQVLAPKAKKSDKGFASGTQLFVYGEFMLSSHKDTYRLIGIDVIEMFHNIRNDLVALSYASYVAEFIQSVTEPNLPQIELMHLTLHTLKVLSSPKCCYKLCRRIFELRALGILGFMPQLLACVECGEVFEEEREPYYFSSEAGGLICPSCRSFYQELIEIHYNTLYTMKYILSVEVKKLYHFTVDQIIQKELDEVCDQYIPYYIDKHFKTIDFIQRIEE